MENFDIGSAAAEAEEQIEDPYAMQPPRQPRQPLPQPDAWQEALRREAPGGRVRAHRDTGRMLPPYGPTGSVERARG